MATPTRLCVALQTRKSACAGVAVAIAPTQATPNAATASIARRPAAALTVPFAVAEAVVIILPLFQRTERPCQRGEVSPASMSKRRHCARARFVEERRRTLIRRIPIPMTRDALFSPFEIVEGDRGKGMVLIADHAGRELPDEYGDLGLPAEEFERHIAYDIGVEAVTRQLAAVLGVPAV